MDKGDFSFNLTRLGKPEEIPENIKKRIPFFLVTLCQLKSLKARKETNFCYQRNDWDFPQKLECLVRLIRHSFGQCPFPRTD